MQPHPIHSPESNIHLSICHTQRGLEYNYTAGHCQRELEDAKRKLIVPPVISFVAVNCYFTLDDSHSCSSHEFPQPSDHEDVVRFLEEDLLPCLPS